MRHGRTLVLVLGTLLVLLLTVGTASAQARDPDRDDQVVLTGRLMVPDGETVGTGVIFDGPATIDGTVRNGLVAFNGDVEISGTVRGDVVAFNGVVTLRSGAQVDGDLITRKAPVVEPGATVTGDQTRIRGRLDFEGVGFFVSRFVWWLGYSISTLILGLVLLALAPGLDGAIARVLRERVGAAVGLGAAFFFLLPVVAVLLLLTVVGIPLGLALLFGLGLVYGVGYVAGVHRIGRLVMKPPKSRFAAFAIGWLILRALALIPVVGGLAWLVAAIFGLGLLFVAARRPGSEPAAIVAPPPAPPMPA